MAKPPAEVWCVYVLRCADGTLYTGITTDLTRRTQQHNDGTASRYTRSRRPVTLVYQESQRKHSSALMREAAIKRLTRKQKLRWSEGHCETHKANRLGGTSCSSVASRPLEDAHRKRSWRESGSTSCCRMSPQRWNAHGIGMWWNDCNQRMKK